MVLSSTSPQVMQIIVPTEMGNESVKSAITSSNVVDSVQATVTKVEQVTDDYVEGNTIVQLDQMRRILAAGGTPDLGPPPTGDGTNNWTEDVHQQEDPLDVSMTEVNLQDIISTPVEDAMTEIMNASAEDATLEETSDAEMKNAEVCPLTSYAATEIVEVQEAVEPIDNDKIKEKVNGTAESQECAGAPVINGQGTVSKPSEGPGFYKILGVSSHNYQWQKITSASGKGDTTKDNVNMKMNNSTGQGAMHEPLNATGFGQTLNASVNKLSTMQGDAELPSGSEKDAAVPGCNELQDAVQTQPKDYVVQDRVDAMQNLILRGNVDDQIENDTLDPAVVQKSVAIPAEDLHITSIGERRVNSFTGEAIDPLAREESTGDGDHCSPDQNEKSKRRKLKVPSHENADGPPSIEVTKMDGNAKTEEQLRQYVRSGSGQLIAFTRRKRKKALTQSSP